MKVGQLMKQVVHVCCPEDTLQEAARIMWDGDCGSVPVVDRESKIVGIVTDRDACMASYTQGRSLSEIPVSTAMAKKVLACKASDTVFLAGKIMRENQVHRVPVVDDKNRVIGILSLNDIAQEAQREIEHGKHDVEPSEVASTLAAVCTPRKGKALARDEKPSAVPPAL